MHNRNVILKARQLGVSTFWLIYMLDAALFYPGVETGCIAHTREDAQELFENKVKLAYDNLPPEIGNMHRQTSDSARKLAFENGSSIRIGTSFRSGTPMIVLVSEFGWIANKYPHQAREIMSGTFNAVPANGILVVESTAMGNEGEYYELVQQGRRHQAAGSRLTAYDFKFFFFSWIDADEYRLNPDDVTVPKEMHEYFQRIEKETGKEIDREKRAWYAAKSGYQLSPEMKREYPSTPDEAFETSVEGTYYYDEMFQTREQGRLTEFLPDKHKVVDTAWDLGYRDATSIIWFQMIDPLNIYVLDYYENSGEGFEHYADVLARKRDEHGIVYGKHYGPHDVGQHSQQTGQTMLDFARGLGVQFTVLPRARDKQDLIECGRRVLPLCHFNIARCSRLVSCLDNYRKEWKTAYGTWGDKPRKDWTTHGADAFQMMAYAVENFGGSQNRMTADRARQLYEQFAPPVL